MNARTKLATFIDFNPSREFWFHDTIMKNFDYELIKSTYLDNKYLPIRERENILSKKDKPGFENWWKVYGLGELGQLEDAILTNWEFGEFDETLPSGYGLDFGVKDPDSLVKCAVDHDKKFIYVKQEIYKSGNSTQDLIETIKSRDVRQKLIIAESASPRTITDIRKAGINIRAVSKGRIVEDVKMLFGWRLIVDPESYDIEKELNNWIWLDKKGEIPIDDYNHLLDAIRYYVRTILVKKVVKRIKVSNRAKNNR
jgi:phage terminase large subunit